MEKPSFGPSIKMFNVIHRKLKDKLHDDRHKVNSELSYNKDAFEILEKFQGSFMQNLKLMTVNCQRTKNLLFEEINIAKMRDLSGGVQEAHKEFISNMLNPFCHINASVSSDLTSISEEAETKNKMILKHFDLISDVVKNAFSEYDILLRYYDNEIKNKVKNQKSRKTLNLNNNKDSTLQQNIYLQTKKLIKVCETYDSYIANDMSIIMYILSKKIISDCFNKIQKAYNTIYRSNIPYILVTDKDLAIYAAIPLKLKSSLAEIAAELTVGMEEVVYFKSKLHMDNTCSELMNMNLTLGEVNLKELLYHQLKVFLYDEKEAEISVLEKFWERELERFEKIMTHNCTNTMIVTIQRCHIFTGELESMLDVDVPKNKFRKQKGKDKRMKTKKMATTIKAEISQTFIAKARNFVFGTKGEIVEILKTDGKGNAKVLKQNGEKGYLPFVVLLIKDPVEGSTLTQHELSTKKMLFKSRYVKSRRPTGIIINSDFKHQKNQRTQPILNDASQELDNLYDEINEMMDLQKYDYNQEENIYDLADVMQYGNEMQLNQNVTEETYDLPDTLAHAEGALEKTENTENRYDLADVMQYGNEMQLNQNVSEETYDLPDTLFHAEGASEITENTDNRYDILDETQKNMERQLPQKVFVILDKTYELPDTLADAKGALEIKENTEETYDLPDTLANAEGALDITENTETDDAKGKSPAKLDDTSIHPDIKANPSANRIHYHNIRMVIGKKISNGSNGSNKMQNYSAIQEEIIKKIKPS